MSENPEVVNTAAPGDVQAREAALRALGPMWDAADAARRAAWNAWPDAEAERHDRIPLAVRELLEGACEALDRAAYDVAEGRSGVTAYAHAADVLAVLALAADRLPAGVADAVRAAVRACAADDADAPVHDTLEAAAVPAALSFAPDPAHRRVENRGDAPPG